ncbi:Os07g0227625 [Oryza sativa Japonica Group]|uniref:Os07g0227625 protein n=1 Tax=Oryza sativa subsp. japonica TaxID=39947 RepID=A0A0P0X418_ORYSJ|nr:Os07g0227625 [Oryza sativa Japonica Group]
MTRVPLVVGMGIRNIRRKLGNSNGVKERLSCECSLHDLGSPMKTTTTKLAGTTDEMGESEGGRRRLLGRS